MKKRFILILLLFLFQSCIKNNFDNPVESIPDLTAPVLLSPSNRATGQPLTIDFSWKECEGAESYRIQVALDNSFSEESLGLDEDSLKEGSIQIYIFENSTQYFWRVAAKNSLGKQMWSEIWSLTTSAGTPGVPTLLSPDNYAANQSINTLLSWNASSTALSYNLQVATDNTFSNGSLIINENVGNRTSKQLSGLSYQKKYYWKIAAVNGSGTSSWSDVWNFTTSGTVLAAPTLSSPYLGATNQSTSPTLCWNAVSGATGYTLQVSTSSSFSSYTQYDNLTVTNPQLSGLFNSTTYYWRVITKNAYGSSSPSATWWFTTSAYSFTGDFIGREYSNSGSRIVRINGQTGAITGLVNNSPYFTAFAYDKDGNLYGIGSSLYIINLQNATFTEVGEFKYNNESISMRSAAISNDGVLYVGESASPNRVFKVNLSTAALTFVGNHPNYYNLAFAPDGTLYGGAFHLYTINKSNMSIIKKIGDYGVYLTDGLSFGKDGILYGADFYETNSIYSINLITGEASKSVSVNSTDIWGCVAERTIKK
jgi:hypothetical protein